MTRLPARSPRRLRAGDVVEIRSEAEILATLDERAQIDGLPFMPEMLQQCGGRFTVSARADTTCFYGKLREMDAAVHLTGVRCDGSAHGGCQAGCLLYWKEEWLRVVEPAEGSGPRPVAPDPPVERAGSTRDDVVRAVHPPDGDDDVWSCQATQVRNATKDIPYWNLWHYVRDVRTGNVTLATVLRRIVPTLVFTYQLLSRAHLPAWLRIARGADVPFVHGRLSRTPLVELGLRPGDRVRVRSRAEIRSTLDRKARNRGLSFDVEMTPYCGRDMRVQRVLTRIINEFTGQMMHLPNRSIVLEGAVCRSLYHGLCQRQTPAFWREAWLEPVERAASDGPDADRAITAAG